MRKIAVIAIFLALFSLLLPLRAEAMSDYLVHTFSINATNCNVSHSANASLYDISSALTHHQFTWRTLQRGLKNATSVAGNMTIWGRADSGPWIRVSNGTTLVEDRVIYLLEGMSLRDLRIEADENFSNSTADTTSTFLDVLYRGWSY